MQHLRSALGMQNADAAVSLLSICHKLFLQEEDVNGFFWCTELLQGILRRSKISTKDLFTYFDQGPENVECSGALAALHIAISAAEDGDIETGKVGFHRCFNEAKSNHLKYLAAIALGRLLLRKSDVLEWLLLATKCGNEFLGTSRIGCYLVAKAFVALGRFQEGLATLKIDGSLLSSALVALLEAEIRIYEDKTSSEIGSTIVAYATARAMLVPLMGNLHGRFSSYVGSSCCSCEDFLDCLHLDEFSKRFILNCSRSSAELEDDEPCQIEECFFIFRGYRESRMQMMQLQEASGSLFMDPRPYLEHGIELVYSEDLFSALEQLVICQQLSIKALHCSGFFWASGLLDIYCSKQAPIHEELVSQIASCFRFRQLDNEDSEAWACYYVGRAGSDVGLLKHSFEISRTDALRYYAALSLGNACDDFEERLHYYELMKYHAEKIGVEDLIISACLYVFGHVRHHISVHNAPKYEKADIVRKSLVKHSFGFSDPKLAQAIIRYMDGLLCFDTKSSSICLKESVNMFKDLPLFPPEKLYHPYLAGDHKDLWSVEKNFSANTAYSNAVFKLRIEDHVQGHHCELQLMNATPSSDTYLMDCLLRIDTLFVNGKLEEAEGEAADMVLHLSEQDGYLQKTFTGLILSKIAAIVVAYYQRGCWMLDDCVLVVNVLMEEASRLAEGYPMVFAHHYSLLLVLGQDPGLELICKTSRLETFEMEENFGGFSEGRINNLERVVYTFQLIQLNLWNAGDFQGALIWAERERARDFMYNVTSRQQRQSYSSELAEFDCNDDKAWKEIQDICQMMGKETVFLVISHCGKHLFIYLLHLGRVQGHSTQMPLVVFTKDILYAGSDDKALFFGLYYDLLIRPFEDQLEEIQPERIIFAPSGDFCELPFGALFNRSNERYLIQNYAISVVSSLRSLKQCELQRLQLEKQWSPTLRSLVVGNPTLDPTLDGAAEEAEFVSEMLRQQARFSEVINLLPNQATKETVMQMLQNKDWVHIATHGVVDEHFPDGALLFFCETKPSDENDLVTAFREASCSGGVLTGDEIMELNQPLKAAAVILSACSSGIGRKFAEGILALPRAFHVCSVPSVVVSLWNVQDDSAKLLMEKLYENLCKGMDISRALRLATVGILEIVNEDGYPVYELEDWAPFFVSGTPCTKLPLY